MHFEFQIYTKIAWIIYFATRTMLTHKIRAKWIECRIFEQISKNYRICAGHACIQIHLNKLHAEALAYIITCLTVFIANDSHANVATSDLSHWMHTFRIYLLSSADCRNKVLHAKNVVTFHDDLCGATGSIFEQNKITYRMKFFQAVFLFFWNNSIDSTGRN